MDDIRCDCQVENLLSVIFSILLAASALSANLGRVDPPLWDVDPARLWGNKSKSRVEVEIQSVINWIYFFIPSSLPLYSNQS